MSKRKISEIDSRTSAAAALDSAVAEEDDIDQADQSLSSSDQGRKGNTNTFRARAYIGVSYLIDDGNEHKIIRERLMICGAHWGIMSLETCPETKKLHYQFAIAFKTMKSVKQIQTIFQNKCHVKKMLGDKKDQLLYCDKERNNIIWEENMDCLGDLEEEKRLLAERQEILDSWELPDPWLENKPYRWQEKFEEEIAPYKEDRRKVYWLWESKGKVGKTHFTQHMVSKWGAVVISGKAHDIKYAIAKMKKDGEMAPKFIILNTPRTHGDCISYQAIEEIKDRLFFSGKYEGGMIKMRFSPTIICFANCEPDVERLSKDRWDIRELPSADMLN